MKPAAFRLVLAVLLLAIAAALPGRAQAQASPSPYTTGHRYDAIGRETGTISPDDGVGTVRYPALRKTYDVRGNLTKAETGELASWKAQSIAPAAWGADFQVFSTVETTYDAMNRKLTDLAKGSDGQPVSLTQYSYDILGRLECTAVRMNPAAFGSLPANACTLGTAGSYGPDRITKSVYDDVGQVLVIKRAFGTALQQDYATYSYNSNRLLTSVTDANGNRAEMTYDGHFRQDKWIFPSKTTAGTADPSDFEQYGYDGNGNRVSLRKRDGTDIAYTYDKLNRMTVKDVDANGERTDLASADRRDVHYAYDLAGLQLSARFDSASGPGALSAYDGFGRLLTATNTLLSGNPALAYQYDRNGNRTSITHPGAVAFDMVFDGLNRPVQLKKGSTVLAAPAYDGRGLVTAIDRSNAALDQAFGHDPAGRLDALDIGGAGQTHSAKVGWDYTRNPASQIVTEARDNSLYAWTGKQNGSLAYTVNGLNQYTAVGANAYCYDANGNLIDDGVSVYRYDVENRLVEMRKRTGPACPSYTSGYGGQLLAALHYDPLGRLHEALKYTFTTGTLEKTTRFLYDGDAMVLEYDGANAIVGRYLHGNDVGADDPLVWYAGSSTADTSIRNLYADPRGSIVLVQGQDGTVVGINTYDEWGNNEGEDSTGRFQYTGQVWLDELGMYYYKARIYSPALGRFMQTDPIGYEDQVNLYAYVGNDPVNGVDPTGTQFVEGGLDPNSTCGGNSNCVAAYTEGQVIALSGIYDFFLGDVEEAIRNPTPGNIAIAVVGLVPAGKGVKLARAAGKFVGKAQKTLRLGRASGHAFASARAAQAMLLTGKYDIAYLNKTLSTITGGKVKSQLKPDVAAVRADGKVDITEILSPGQNSSDLRKKYASALGDMMGDFKAESPKLSRCIGSLIKKEVCP